MPAYLPCFGTAAVPGVKLDERRWRSSAPDHNRLRQPPALPAASLKLGNCVVGLWIAETEIADEFPVRGNCENLGNRLRIEDRYPAQADALGARCEPDRMDCGDRRILDHLRHRATPEAVALRGRGVGEYRKMAWRFGEAGELELRVETGAFVLLRGERCGIAGFEIALDRRATRRILDNDKAPRLAQAHRGSKTSKLDERLQRAAGQWIAAKAADIAAPEQKIAQPGPECGIKPGRLIRSRALGRAGRS